MAGTTGIPWCDKCWNVVAGCTRVSEGCEHCWAVNTANRLSGHPNATARAAVEGTVAMRNGRLDWTGLVRTLPERLAQPLRWRTPARIFIASQADLFHPAVPGEFIARVFATMGAARQHTFQVLTKRPQRMRDLLSDAGFWQAVGWRMTPLLRPNSAPGPWPWPHVWVGVTAENQRRADERIPLLLKTPAAVRWVSVEPLLGPVGVARWLQCDFDAETVERQHPVSGDTLQRVRIRPRVDLVIVGGESRGTPERRLVSPCHAHPPPGYAPACPHCHGTGWAPKPEALAWLRALRDECVAAAVPFWFKGFGGPAPRAAGRLLDGRTWEQLPVGGP